MTSNPGGSYEHGNGDEWEPTRPNSAFSPPVIALVAVIASAFLIVSYYSYFLQRCKPRFWGLRTRDDDEVVVQDSDGLQNIPMASGLDEAVMKKIPVCRYRKGDFLIEGTECAVCLVEFQENENLRFLPKCSHAFHIECIDMWLKSHANCPLCRSNVLGSSMNIALLEQISSVINNTSELIARAEAIEENTDDTQNSAISAQQEVTKSGDLSIEDAENLAAEEVGIFKTPTLSRSFSMGSHEAHCFSSSEFMQPQSTLCGTMTKKMLAQPLTVNPSSRTATFMWTQTNGVSRWEHNDSLSILMLPAAHQERKHGESSSCCDIRSEETLIDMTNYRLGALAYQWRSLDSMKHPCNKTTPSRLRSGDPEALLSPRTFSYNHVQLKLP